MAEGGCGRHRRRKGREEKAREEESRSGKRNAEREEEKTVVDKRRCVKPVSGDAVEEFNRVEDSDGCGNSWGDLLGDLCDLCGCVPEVSSGVLVVTDVLDSPSSLVVMSEALLSDFDCEIVEPQSSSLARKRQAFLVESQEDMNHHGTPVKALPASRRKILPPTQQQGQQPSIEAMQLQMEMEDQENCRG